MKQKYAPHPLDAEIAELELQLYRLRQKRKSDRMKAAIAAMWGDPQKRRARMGKFRSPETRAKLGKIVRERLANPAERARLSAQASAQWADEDTRARMTQGIKTERQVRRALKMRDPLEERLFGVGPHD